MSRADEIQALQTLLIRRRDQLKRALNGDLSAMRQLRESGDEADWAASASQGEISSRLAQVESRELGLIERALERIRVGDYGVCEMTGKPIPMARLKALPYATLCVEAQRELELHGGLEEWRRRKEDPSWEEEEE